MKSTTLKYLDDFNLTTAKAKVLEANKDGERDVVVLDETIFYPQGGGQPYDTGIIESDSSKFLVEEVRLVDGLVKHTGKFEKGTFDPNETVTCIIDRGRRSLHSRLHSAGHVVDMAVHSLDLKWTPRKGYHFPQGPYVEYSGNFYGIDKEKLKNDIEKACNQFVKEEKETKLVFMNKDEMAKVCHFVPDYIPEGKLSRVVMYGDFGVPCGGTHVSNLSEIGSITIRKIKTEKGNIRVGYGIDPDLHA